MSKKAALIIIFLFSLGSLYGTEELPSFYIKSIFTTGGRISGPVLKDPRGGFLIFSEDRYVYSFLGNGELRTRKRVSGKPVPYQAQGLDGIIYKYFDNTVLKAVNIKGDILWSINVEKPPVFDPVINAMGNIITVTDDKIISYSYMGRKRWEIGADSIAKQDKKNAEVQKGTQREVQSSFFSTPLIVAAGGIVYAGMSGGVVIAIDNHGQIIKTAKISSSRITALNVISNGAVVCDKDSNLFLLDLRELKIIRTAKLRSPGTSVIANNEGNVIAVLGKAGNIQLFDNTLAPYSARIRGNGFTGMPLCFGNSFYFVRDNGFILRFDINQGKAEEIPIPVEAVYGLRSAADNITIPLTISAYKNMIIAGGLDWNLYLIEERDRKNYSGQDYINTYTYQNHDDVIPDTKYLIYINELSRSEDNSSREKAFELLDNVLLEKISANDEKFILSILGRVAYGPAGRTVKTPYKSESPVIRTKAALIAGRIGTIETVSMIRNMLKYEAEPVIASIMIKELGKAGSDPFGESVRLFESVYNRFFDDLNVVENIITGVRSINNYQGFLYEEGKNLLFKMLERNEKRDLELKIMDVLRTLDVAVQ